MSIYIYIYIYVRVCVCNKYVYFYSGGRGRVVQAAVDAGRAGQCHNSRAPKCAARPATVTLRR